MLHMVEHKPLIPFVFAFGGHRFSQQNKLYENTICKVCYHYNILVFTMFKENEKKKANNFVEI